MFKHSLYPGSYLARITLPIPAAHFEKTTFLSGPKYMEDPVRALEQKAEAFRIPFLPNSQIHMITLSPHCALVFLTSVPFSSRKLFQFLKIQTVNFRIRKSDMAESQSSRWSIETGEFNHLKRLILFYLYNSCFAWDLRKFN